ncbi:hypothetical protein [Persicobacter diffluens]|uniref:Uncharacterized protein n=1 Tax=Persicobacter diffluens TaxID=981 RepID=A0AAN4W4M2_9BACT|nr:hypothetical protein PEDI_51430 [Persicobacter diffluens]
MPVFLKIVDMTEKEILLANRKNLRLIDQIIIREKENLTNISSEMPCVVHLNNMQHLGIEQMNEFGTSLLRLSHDELISLGENFVKNYLHPEDVKL